MGVICTSAHPFLKKLKTDVTWSDAGQLGFSAI